MGSRLFALGDLHLSFARPKPMEVFGPAWAGHPEPLARAWRETVGPEDVVLLAGDHSWALRPGDAAPDLDFIASLPGQKILVKGNHDYWWPDGAARRRALERPGLRLLHGEAVSAGGCSVAGTRLWDFPECRWEGAEEAPPEGAPAGEGGPRPGAPDPGALRARETERLRGRLARLDPSAPLRACLLHYPPLGAGGAPTGLTDLIGAAGVDWCVFGHIHGHWPARPAGARCRLGATEYVLASADQAGFRPVYLADMP